MESSNKKKSAIASSILRAFASSPFESLNYKQVASRIGYNDRASREMVMNHVLKMAEEGTLIEDEKGKYKLNSKFISDDILPNNYIIGTVDMKQTGKAYVIPDNGTEDIFISQNNTNHALNNDKVKVYLFPQRKDRKREGQITEIIERKKTSFVGTIQKSQKFAFFVPDSSSMPVDLFIALEDLNGAKDGQKVLAEISQWPERANNPFGRVIKVLGEPGDNDVEMQSILAEYDFPLFFPEAVEKEAENIPFEIPQEEIKKRKDYRKILTYTIDPEDAKDFDDAISFRILDNGNLEVGVHIADVSHYVRPGSLIDEEAYKRGTSVYLVDRTIPMLPEKLSNGVCSLRPNEDSLTFSAIFEMNQDAEIISEWFGRTVIHSDKRFSYEDAQKIIEEQQGELSEYVLPVHRLATILRKKRFKTGAINFESQEVKFRLDENSKPIGIYIKESKEANWLIEEFMLLANKHVAERIGKAKKDNKEAKTFVYRVHDEPNPDKLTVFTEFVSKMGYQVNTQNRSTLAKSLNNLFKDITGKGEENMISTIAIRTMSKAYYSTDNIGHYGLAFPYYTHFTSPIRRYPDLMVHRLLEKYLENKPSVSKEVYEEKCEKCSIMEKKAADAERLSVKYKQAEFLSDKIGFVFAGVISGVSKWGLYVLIDENKCEGLIPIRTMTDDFYYIDEDNYQVVGRHSNKTYRLGDPIKIKVERVDLMKKQMDFSLVDDGEILAPKRDFSPEKIEESSQRDRGRGQSKSYKPKNSSSGSGKRASSSSNGASGARKQTTTKKKRR